MEVILLWLDDLDDLLFSGALAAAKLRRLALQLGLASALGLAASELGVLAARCAPELAAIACASVSLWLFAFAVSACSTVGLCWRRAKA
jgi:hypothetical protein